MDYENSTTLMKDLGLNPRNWTDQVIVAEALSRGISVSKSTNNYVILNDSNGKKFTWKSGFTNYNTILAQRVANHKDLFSRLLSAYDAPGTENCVFGPTEVARAWVWAESLGEIVVKPADGIHGKNVFTGITTFEQFVKAFTAIVKAGHKRILVEKFYRGTEHRCYLVNHKLVAVTRRRPANVLGDGSSTVEELIIEKNSLPERRYPTSKVHSAVPLDELSLEVLNKANLTPQSIPNRGQRVYLRTVSNIHSGGDAIDATDELTEEEVQRVEHASRVVAGGRVVGLDVLLPRSDGDDDMRIIEMNTNSMTSIHHFPWEGKPRNVAGAILDAFYPSTK